MLAIQKTYGKKHTKYFFYEIKLFVYGNMYPW